MFFNCSHFPLPPFSLEVCGHSVEDKKWNKKNPIIHYQVIILQSYFWSHHEPWHQSLDGLFCPHKSWGGNRSQELKCTSDNKVLWTCHNQLLQRKVHLLCISDAVRSSWRTSIDLSLIIHKGPISSLQCYTIWSSVGTILTCPGHLGSAVSIIRSPLQSWLSFFSLYFHHSCSLPPFSYPYLSLSWVRSQLFPLLPICLHISPHMVATKHPFASVQRGNGYFLPLPSVSLSRVWSIVI